MEAVQYIFRICIQFKNIVEGGKRSKSMEMMLEEKVQRQKILTDALNAMDDDSSATINAIMAQTGEYLNVDVMAIYAKDEDGVYDCSYLWTRGHNMSAEEYIFNWQKGKSLLNNKRTPGVEYILVDNNHKNKIFEEEMENGNVKSFVAFYIEINNLVSGVLSWPIQMRKRYGPRKNWNLQTISEM